MNQIFNQSLKPVLCGTLYVLGAFLGYISVGPTKKALQEESKTPSRILPSSTDSSLSAATLDIVKTSSPSDFSSLWRQYYLSRSPDRELVLWALVERWVDYSPEEALTMVEKLETLDEKHLLVKMLFSVWGRTSPDAVVAARALEPTLRILALHALADNSLSSKTRFLLGMELDPETSKYAVNLERLWDILDEDGQELSTSIEITSRIPASIVEQLVATIAESKTHADLDTALIWVRSLHSGSLRSNALQSVISVLANEDVDKSLNTLDLVSGWRNDSKLVDVVADALVSQKGVQEAIDLLRGFNGRNRIDSIEKVLGRAFQMDPENAKDLYTSLKDHSRIGFANETAFAARYAEVDPKGAAEWVDDRIGRVGTMSLVAEKWAAKNLSDAIAHIDKVSNQAQRLEFAAGIGEHMGRSNPADALAWSDRLGQDVKDQAMEGVIRGWGTVAPAQSAEYVGNVEDEVLQGQLANTLIHQWALDDPIAAAAWLKQDMISNPNVDDSVRNLLGIWAQADPYSASEWLGELPAGPIQDAGITEFVKKSLFIDPDTATTWAISIADRKTRNVTLGSLLDGINRRDPQVAKELMNRVEPVLTEGEFKKILGFVNR